jgi:predicted RNA-binding protein with PIN domain
MASILVDGYNLIGIFHKDLEKAREGLISRLERYCSVKGHELTIIFDGWKEGQPDETKTRLGRVTVIYSRLGEKADSVIERILKERKRSWIVVSSDRAISDFAWSMGYASVSSQEFEGKIESSTLRGYFDELEEEEINRPRKGNPRQPNKRQRLKIKALEKL